MFLLCDHDLPDRPVQGQLNAFFANVISGWTVGDHNDDAKWKNNDLQTGKLSGSSCSMKHSLGLVRVTLGSKTVATTRKSSVNAGTTSDNGTTTINASTIFQGAAPYLSSGKYLRLFNNNNETTISSGSTSLQKWSDITPTVSGGNYVDVTAAVAWPYAWYKYEWHYVHRTSYYTFSTSTTGTGSYKMECWGASGGTVTNTQSPEGYNKSTTGYGGYTAGTITLTGTSTSLYVYVGGKGKTTYKSQVKYNEGGWNGGGYTGGNSGSAEVDYNAGGGGATDIRLTASSDPLAFASLKSRIMVAGGGGGAVFLNNSANDNNNTSSSTGGHDSNGGNAGGLTGSNGVGKNVYSLAAHLATGGKQNAPGTQAHAASDNYQPNASFGYASQIGNGGSSGVAPQWWNAGGGGGWYGGAKGSGGGGAGGSSYISGHTGCYAIVQSSTVSSITHYDGQGGRTTSSKYNNANTWVFSGTSMISGASSMPKADGSGNATGNLGDGYAKITFTPSTPLSD